MPGWIQTAAADSRLPDEATAAVQRGFDSMEEAVAALAAVLEVTVGSKPAGSPTAAVQSEVEASKPESHWAIVADPTAVAGSMPLTAIPNTESGTSTTSEIWQGRHFSTLSVLSFTLQINLVCSHGPFLSSSTNFHLHITNFHLLLLCT